MKTLLKILLISSCLYSCKGLNEKDASTQNDSTHTTLPPDSASSNDNNGVNSMETEDPARETTRQIMANLLSSKKEIGQLKYDVRDSLSKSGLSAEKRLLFSQTIQELDESSRLVNKQIEQIVVSDLQESRGKLSEIVQKMKGSEKELGGIIARLDKITNYMQVATNLIQSLVPVPAAKSHSKEDK
jgi:dGTP triphosphohydrolase